MRFLGGGVGFFMVKKTSLFTQVLEFHLIHSIYFGVDFQVFMILIFREESFLQEV